MGAVVILVSAICAAGGSRRTVTVELRTRVEPFRGSGEWIEVKVPRELAPAETAIVICDMWDKHWCQGATKRVGLLVQKMNPFIDRARDAGITIIHAPSDTMDFYAGQPQRLIMTTFPAVQPTAELTLPEPPLPIDDTDGGCDTPDDKEHKAWTREHPGLHVDARDFISDNGTEIYNLLRARGINTLLVMGVHTNMCILNRSFAIKQMTKWGIRCILVRDLTDAMYDPEDRPFVSHEAGTELVIQHIEKYWAPSVLSAQLTSALTR
jgi:nicotinamidase-related amidase